MKPHVVYNTLTLAGTVMVGAGTYLVAGLGESLIASGVVVLGLTIYVFERSSGRSDD